MRGLKTIFLTVAAALFALSLATASEAREDSDAKQVDIGFFFAELEPHGTWVRHDEFDYVFVPDVKRGWRPYVHGHWVWADDLGWYWASQEPFAWAAYHYGRWGYEPEFGWFWVPGNVWAPAWVTWRKGGGHIGWAPMAPHGQGYVIGYVDYYEPPIIEAWVFVPERRFIEVNLVSYVEPVVEVNLFLTETRETFHVRQRDGRVVNEFLPRNEVAQIVGTEIETYKVSDVTDPDEQALGGDTIKAFRADVAETKPEETPKDVVEAPEQLENKPVLFETAKGDRPEGAPPSAAELKPSEPGKADEAAKPKVNEAEKAKETRPGKEPRSNEAEERAQPDKQPTGKDETAPADQKEAERAGKKGKAAEKKQPEPSEEKQAEPAKKTDESDPTAKPREGKPQPKLGEGQKPAAPKEEAGPGKQKSESAGKRDEAQPGKPKDASKQNEAVGKRSDPQAPDKQAKPGLEQDGKSSAKEAKPDKEPKAGKESRAEPSNRGESESRSPEKGGGDKSKAGKKDQKNQSPPG